MSQRLFLHIFILSNNSSQDSGSPRTFTPAFCHRVRDVFDSLDHDCLWIKNIPLVTHCCELSLVIEKSVVAACKLIFNDDFFIWKSLIAFFYNIQWEKYSTAAFPLIFFHRQVTLRLYEGLLKLIIRWKLRSCLAVRYDERRRSDFWSCRQHLKGDYQGYGTLYDEFFVITDVITFVFLVTVPPLCISSSLFRRSVLAD